MDTGRDKQITYSIASLFSEVLGIDISGSVLLGEHSIMDLHPQPSLNFF